MSKTITACKVFIGSAGGLDNFRQEFRDVLNQFNQDEALHRGYAFFPMGWELTVGGVGRPQEQINEELRACDYAVFMFRNRWGTPPSKDGKYTSGTEEEWAVANEQYEKLNLRAIQGCFFPFVANNTSEEAAQHGKVLAFKAELEAGKRFFFKSFNKDSEFGAWLRTCLSDWLRQLERTNNHDAPNKPVELSKIGITDMDPKKKDIPELLFKFADWNVRALAAHLTGQYEDAVFYFGKASADKAAKSIETATALGNKGITLGQLNRSEDEIAVYDALLLKFEGSKEAAIQEQVARAMVNKGVRLGQINRSEDAIAVYDALLLKFEGSKEAAIQEQVAMAMVNKGVRLGLLNRSEDEIAVYDALLLKFEGSKEAAIQEPVARAMVNKGVRLGLLNRSEDAIAVYDALLLKFEGSKEAAIQEQVARAMVNKGVRLGLLNRSEDEIAVYDALLLKFEGSKEAAIQKQVARAMFNKGVTLGQLNRSEDEIAVYDALLLKFEGSKEAAIQEQVVNAMNGKGFALLKAAKEKWMDVAVRNKLLANASTLFADAFARDSKSAIYIGNQAYTAWLMGDKVLAEEKFKSALAAPESGGEAIYKGTLSDLDIHPVDADAGFKVLIDRLWHEYKKTSQ